MRRTSVYFPNFRTGWDSLLDDEALHSPRSHVAETPEAYFIQLDLPGVARDDIKISVEREHLVIEAERKGPFALRSRKEFLLPSDVDLDKAESQLTNGVLELALPKQAQAKPKVIAVGEGRDSGLFQKLIGKKTEKAST